MVFSRSVGDFYKKSMRAASAERIFLDTTGPGKI
jgi:hypothetical protein